MTATAEPSSPSVGASHHMVIWKAIKEQKNETIGFANRWRHLPKILYAYNIELPQLVGGAVCVMTFLHISNRLAVKQKKHISPLGGATYPKYYRPIISSYPDLWGSVL